MKDLVELEMTGVKDSFRGEVVNIQQFDQVMCFRPPTWLRDTTVETSSSNRGHSGTGSIVLLYQCNARWPGCQASGWRVSLPD